MNLREYLKQFDPIKNPRVTLHRHEVEVGSSVKVGDTVLTQIFITDPDFQILAGSNEYVLKSGSVSLWTVDKHGNPDKRSVFEFDINSFKVPDWVYNNLCLYDKRNPNFVEDKIDSKTENCTCENCSYARSPLADLILSYYEQKYGGC
jgi:hypothetical protein